MNEVLFKVNLDDVNIKVEKDGQGWLIVWNDGVINEWHHKCHLLSEAFQFLSNLMICKEAGWQIVLTEVIRVNENGESIQ